VADGALSGIICLSFYDAWRHALLDTATDGCEDELEARQWLIESVETFSGQ
jgi:hypothetical protein